MIYRKDLLGVIYLGNDSVTDLFNERDLALLARVRDTYLRLAREPGWLTLDGERSPDEVARDVLTNVQTRLAQP